MNISTVFVTAVNSYEDGKYARVLIDSIRAFGGALSQSPIRVFAGDSQNAPYTDVQVLPLRVPDTIRHYLFADKVFACAQAEAMMDGQAQSLVWIDSTCLVVNPPVLYDLGLSFDVAVRPVHIKNVGLAPTEPLDLFWKTIYTAVGVADVQSTVESFVDRQRLRSYFNSHAFALNPSRGLCRDWLDQFQALVCDQKFQATACQDQRHRIFLFQAILSALIVTQFDTQRIRILPPTYNYPYNLHSSVPAEHRAKSLDDLVCLTYETRTLDPDMMNDVEMSASLREWLSVHTKIKEAEGEQ